MIRGKLVVFEGPEGAGKTTQLRLVSEWLSTCGAEVVAVREPGGTVLGDEIRRILLDPGSEITARAEALLFMASRAQLVEREIVPALQQGVIVLLDRFFLSTYAYQGAGRGLPDEVIPVVNRFATDGLVPDVTLLLSVPAEEGLDRAARRGTQDRMEQADVAFHQRVADAFERFATPGWQAAHPECGPIVLIDARGTEAEVFARVRLALHGRWPTSFPLG